MDLICRRTSIPSGCDMIISSNTMSTSPSNTLFTTPSPLTTVVVLYPSSENNLASISQMSGSSSTISIAGFLDSVPIKSMQSLIVLSKRVPKIYRVCHYLSAQVGTPTCYYSMSYYNRFAFTIQIECPVLANTLICRKCYFLIAHLCGQNKQLIGKWILLKIIYLSRQC